MSAGWLSFAIYERFLIAARAEVKRATGESEEELDLRIIRESGGRMLAILYKFMLFWFKPTTILSRLPTLNAKIYDQGKLDLIQNTPGCCVLRQIGPKEVHDHAQRYTITGVEFLLELASAKDIKSSILKDEEGEQDFLLEVSITYQHGE